MRVVPQLVLDENLVFYLKNFQNAASNKTVSY